MVNTSSESNPLAHVKSGSSLLAMGAEPMVDAQESTQRFHAEFDSRRQESGATERSIEAQQNAQARQRLANDDLKEQNECESDEASAPQEVYAQLLKSALAVAMAELGLGQLRGIVTVDPMASSDAQAKPMPQGTQSGSTSGETATHSTSRTSMPESVLPVAPERPGVADQPKPVKAPSHTSAEARHAAKQPEPIVMNPSSSRSASGHIPVTTTESSAPKSSPPVPSNAVVTASYGTSRFTGDPSGASTGQNNESGLDFKAQVHKQMQASVKSEAAELPRPVREQVLHDVLRVMRSNLNQRNSMVKLQLSPPELGRLIIEMRFHGNTLDVKMEAQDARVQELLTSHANELKNALLEQGLKVDKFLIHVHPQDQPPVESQTDMHEGGDESAPASQQFGSAGGTGAERDGSEGAKQEDATEVESQNITAERVDIRA